MFEIKNKTRGPVQLVVRSKKSPRSFTTLIIPGVGKGKNVRLISDESMTDYVIRVEKNFGLISTRYIPNAELVSEQNESNL
jgi:hypothetical protein